MDTKAAFEKFLQRKGISCEHWDDTDESYGYISEEADALLEAWLESWSASREAIEIELPERARLESHGKHKGRYLCGDCSFDAEYALGINHTIDWFKEAITSHEIRIKGKTE